LAKDYPAGDGTTRALDGVTLALSEGEFVSLVGPSGCGKTTLLRLIAGLAHPGSGSIGVGRGGGGARIAMVFQEHGLFPWMTAVDNAAFGLEALGVPRRERRRRALEFMEQFNLGGFAVHYPAQLSAGMRQRVGIVRAFLVEPDILLMDEPLASLDAQTRRILQEELLRVWEQRRTTVLYVTHDIGEAALLGDRILVMAGRPGRVREEIVVTLPRPRDADRDGEAIAQIEASVWRMLAEEVRLVSGGGG
jgi:NitT/TauT family transport system ATP-binding protein